MTISLDDKLGASFAHAVRFAATEPIVLSKLPIQFQVLIDLVGGDDDDTTDAGCLTRGLKDVDGAHDVDVESLGRAAIRFPHERLGGKMKHDLRPLRPNHIQQLRQIADIGPHIVR